MIKMKSPTPNRKGVYEVHDVPSRRVKALRAEGWTEVKPEKPAAEYPAEEKPVRKKRTTKKYK